jgi:6-phosphofructokinase 1
MATFGILVEGGPAPGINGVIGSAAILARRQGARVLGIPSGFEGLMAGDTKSVRELHIGEVSRIHLLGGSVLQTSRANPTQRPEDLARVVGSLEALGVDHLITIGGDGTCHSARRVSEQARGRIRVAHVPKTIDNDLPLPPGIPTFGFETARAEAARILSHLMEDARTTARWYVVVVQGRSAGHLALGAANAAGATLALIAEEFPGGHIPLARVASNIEAAVVKRMAVGRPYGVAVLAEGIGERLEPADLAGLRELPRDQHGRVRLAELPLARLVIARVRAGLTELGLEMTLAEKNIGYELRCAPPNAFDIAYTRDLGAGAVHSLLDGNHGVMITRHADAIVPIRFEDILDPETDRTKVRLFDVTSPSYASAREMQVRLEAEDLEPGRVCTRLQALTRLDSEALRERWAAALV